MAIVVFLRGVNVGGHRRFRPSLLARELADYDVVSVGAAGTFVVRRPGSRAALRAALRRRLPFDAVVVMCDGRELLRLVRENPFAAEPARRDRVHFVSILARSPRAQRSMPTFPPRGLWHVRVLRVRRRFVCGVYRRRMQTIGYLGQLDEWFGAPATTRSWQTIVAIAGILQR